MDSRERRFKALLQEKQQRHSELLDYNKRLDRTVVLYLTGLYAAIGLQSTGNLRFSDASSDLDFTPLILLFIFLNASILLHAVSQLAWCMSLAKFLHLKIDPELKALARDEPHIRTCENPDLVQLDQVDALDWDDWQKDIKGIANETLPAAVILWFVVVLLSSVLSLTVVDVRAFLGEWWLVGWGSIVVLIVVHWYVLFRIFLAVCYFRRFHDLHASLSLCRGIAVGVFAAILTGLLVLLALWAATYRT